MPPVAVMDVKHFSALIMIPVSFCLENAARSNISGFFNIKLQKNGCRKSFHKYYHFGLRKSFNKERNNKRFHC